MGEGKKKSTGKKRPEIILSCPALIARHLFCPPVNCLWWLDESLVSGLAFRLRLCGANGDFLLGIYYCIWDTKV